MEHLNRVAKTAIEGLGANKSEKAIVSLEDCRHSISSNIIFDNQHHVPADSASHSNKSSAKDLNKVVNVLQQQNVFRTLAEGNTNSLGH